MIHYIRELAASYAARDKPEPAGWYSILGTVFIGALMGLALLGKTQVLM